MPTCFNATVHFGKTVAGGNQRGAYHHQITPAVGTKPAGFRSVLRGTNGERVTLYWWESSRLWRLEVPNDGPITHTQEVTIVPPAGEEQAFTWQWCDLIGPAAANAREINWHPYTQDHGAEVEDAWARKAEKSITGRPAGQVATQLQSWLLG